MHCISNRFYEHGYEFIVLKCPQQSPDLTLTEPLWEVVELEISIMHVQKLWCYCQYGPKSFRILFNTLLNLCHEELREL